MQNDLQIMREDHVIRPKGDLVIRIERITKEYADGAHDHPGAEGR